MFIGVGIATFYEAPKMPEYRAEIKRPLSKEPTEAELQEQDAYQREYDALMQTHRNQSRLYNRNVSAITLTLSVLILVVSLTLFKRLLVIADGLLLGGILTLLYSLIRGFEAQDTLFRFMVVTVGLIVSLVLGYMKFIKPEQSR